jgi:hypothetical protein
MTNCHDSTDVFTVIVGATPLMLGKEKEGSFGNVGNFGSFGIVGRGMGGIIGSFKLGILK